MSTKQIDIRIDRLTLRGVDPANRDQITATVTRELERYIAQHGVPRHWTRGDAVRIPRLAAQSSSSPTRVGETIARAIYRGGK